MSEMDRQYCTFFLGDALCGIETKAVTEIVSRFRATPVPRSRTCIAGLMNHRGHIVTLVSLGTALELPELPELPQLPELKDTRLNQERKQTGHKNTVIFVKDQGELTGLLVDEIGGVVTVNAASGQAPPETIGALLRQAVFSVYPSSGRLLLALDVPRLFRMPTLVATAREDSHELVS